MTWFKYLKGKGYFEPEANPALVAVDKGFQAPHWEVLDYLEKLAVHFANGRHLELAPELIEIIDKVSLAPKDNHITWYRLIKILSHFPNELVPLSILDHIPAWLSGPVDTNLQSLELVNDLLPKFLRDDPTPEDTKKAEKILYHLLEIRKGETHNYTSGHYRSPIYLYYLKDRLVDHAYMQKIAAQCSFAPVDRLLGQLNLMLRDHPLDEEIKEGNIQWLISTRPEDDKLTVIFGRSEEGQPGKIEAIEFPDYTSLPYNEIMRSILEKAVSFGIPEEHLSPETQLWKKIRFFLSNDLASIYGHAHIEDAEDNADNGDAQEVFAYLLRDMLNAYLKSKPQQAAAYLATLDQDPRFNLPFFKRLIFYLVAENLELLRPLAWKMLGTDDPNRYFSTHAIKPELHFLLRKMAPTLSAGEIATLQNILEHGPVGDDHYDVNEDQWRHRWLDALQLNESFREPFDSLTQKLGFTKKIDYAGEGKIRILKGHRSPYTESELLVMPNEDIINLLHEYQAPGDFEGPSLDGLADTLGKTAEADPQKIAGILMEITDVPAIYHVQLMYAFTNAWQKQKEFDWSVLLDFCLAIILKDKIDLLHPKGQRMAVSKDWLYLAMARMISEGVRNDANAFAAPLLPKAETILVKLAERMEPVQRDRTNDYPMQFVNSFQGTVLRALMDYNLRVARITSDPTPEPKWKPYVLSLIEQAFNKKVIEAWTLIGMYYPQFLYLDGNWTMQKISSFYESAEDYWLAFMGGIAFTNPPSNAPLYEIMYPHYKRAIDSGVGLNTLYHQGIIRHLSAFYFWDLEDLQNENSLLGQLIKKAPVTSLQELSQFLRIQYKAVEEAEAVEKQALKAKVMLIWKRMAERVAVPALKDEEELLAGFVYLAEYIDELDETNTWLLALSAKYAHTYHNLHELFEELVRLMNVSYPKYISEVLVNVSFTEYIYDLDENAVITIVQFLYDNGEKEAANTICNKIAINGQEFLIKLYHQYNNPATN